MKKNNDEIQEFYNHHIKTINPNFYEENRWFLNRYNAQQYSDTFKEIFRVAEKYATNNNILEIGAGAGTWTRVFLKCNTSSIVISDISSSMIEQSKKNLGNRSNLNYIEGDFTSFNESRKYDAIFAIRCIEYFSSKEKFFEKSSSLLKTGGKLIIITKKKSFLKSSRAQHQRQLHINQVCEISNQFFSVDKITPVSLDIRIPRLFKFYWLSSFFKKNVSSNFIKKYMSFFIESYLVVLTKK
jgi:ubiquinone/menaquinone biosynthesis C-methylase UbiE